MHKVLYSEHGAQAEGAHGQHYMLGARTTTPDAHSATIKQAYEDLRAKRITLAAFGAIVRRERGL